MLSSFVALVLLIGTPQEIPPSMSEIEHIHHPSEQFFTSGQPTEEQYEVIAENGVRHVINLRSQDEMDAIPEPSWATQHTIAYYHIPIAGPGDLTPQNVALFNDILARIGDDRALMHCASSNRVGAMMALRAAWHQDVAVDDAITLGRRFGMTSLEQAVISALADAD